LIDCNKSFYDLSLQAKEPGLAGSISEKYLKLKCFGNPGILQFAACLSSNNAATHAAYEPLGCMNKPNLEPERLVAVKSISCVIFFT
jgi:hypothetical protein